MGKPVYPSWADLDVLIEQIYKVARPGKLKGARMAWKDRELVKAWETAYRDSFERYMTELIQEREK